MKHVHVLEFEDLSWFPAWLRTCMTNNLVVFARLLGVNYVLGQLITETLRKTQRSKIIDLGSGAGGSLPDILEEIRQKKGMEHVQLELSDKYPNSDAIQKFNHTARNEIRYCESSVDATQLETAPDGLKTMVNCFHHMRPPQAQAILESAVKNRQPILIYEMGGHITMPFPIWLLGLPIGFTFVFLMALIKSALVRPITWKQLVFTYVIPLIPLFYAWDGQASTARMYTETDIDELLSGLENPDYTWEKGYGKSKRGGKLGSYLLGLPNKAQHPPMTESSF